MSKTVVTASATALALVTVLSLSACESTEGHKTDIGTVAGAIVGGLAGQSVGSGRGRVLATLAGAAGGAWIGRQIGAALDERDRQHLAESTQETVVTGEAQEWSNPESGVQGRTEVVGEDRETSVVEVAVLRERVETLPPLEMIGERYRATSDSNVRGGPGTDYALVGSLAAGETVHVLGRVRDQSWHVIAENGAASGFVHTNLLELAPADSAPPAPPARPAAVQTAMVETDRQCRSVKQTVVMADGDEREETVRACRGSGGWEVI